MVRGTILSAVVGLFAISSALPPPCPDGWKHRSESCYKHHSNTDSWSGAAYHCKRDGAKLVEIDSISENQFVHSNFLKDDGRDHWINLHRCGGSLWCHQSMETPKFTNWDKIQPDNRDGMYEGCGEMWFNGKWHDAQCQEHQPFICEKASSKSDSAPEVLCKYLKKWGRCDEPIVEYTYCKETCAVNKKNKILAGIS